MRHWRSRCLGGEPDSEEHDKQDQRYEPDQSGMYELEFPAPQLSSTDGRGPVMIHALEGFSDAGHAIRLAAQHLKDSLDTELVASFAIDELLDYRSRRPLMTFKTDHFTHYEEPELSLYALHDSVGTPFLLLAGMEPDLRWERFITAVRLLAERLDVRQTIGLGTIPMAVPHTRPITLTAHANNKELIAGHTPWVGEVQVPGSVSNLLEYRMAQHGHDVGRVHRARAALPRPDRLSGRRRGAAHPGRQVRLAAAAADRAVRGGRRSARQKSRNRSVRAPRSLKWWRHWSASTMPSSRPRRTNHCWRATRICPAVTSSGPSSNDFSRSRAGTREKKASKTGTTAIRPSPSPTTRLAR